jgi:carboxylesterase
MAAPFGIAIAVAAALLARFVAGRWYERVNAAKYKRGEDGVVLGAEGIELRSEGKAALLLLHGFGDTPQTLRELAHALHAEGYAVSVPLLPGHGRTLRGFVSTNAVQWLAEADAALARLRRDHAIVGVVGLSMGGALATIVASANQDVRCVMLIAPYLSVPPTVRRFARWRWLVNHILPYFPGMGQRSIHDERARAQSLAYGALNANVLSELVSVVDRADAALPSLRVPVLMLQSREDNRIPEAAAERAFQRIGSRDKQLEWLTGCGHVLTVDYQRERVTQEAIRWLNRVMPAPPAEARAYQGT